MRKLLTALFLILATTVAFAHVGSADVYYEGDAGPYHLFVTVRLPQVIPGISQIQVRSVSQDVQTVHVVILRLTGPGSNLPSIPDLAQRSKIDAQFFESNLWFMEYGALQVRITAEGSKGKAELSVPVASFPRQPLPMSGWLRGLGAFVLIFLTLSMVPIVGGVVREISVPPGEAPQASNKRRSRTAIVSALIVTIACLYSDPGVVGCRGGHVRQLRKSPQTAQSGNNALGGRAGWRSGLPKNSCFLSLARVT